MSHPEENTEAHESTVVELNEAAKQAAHDAVAESAADPRDQLVSDLQEEVLKLRDQWVRAVAETDNVRKRSQRDLEESSKYAITGFAGDMVQVLENLKRAADTVPLEARDGNDLLKSLAEGIDLTLQELLRIFDKFGIKRVDPQGQKFDHNLHQAVVQVENNDVEAGTVVQVVQSGYVIGDRLLRPAMVVVSKISSDNTKKVDTTA
jgi:molecular chaperone GrpE